MRPRYDAVPARVGEESVPLASPESKFTSCGLGHSSILSCSPYAVCDSNKNTLLQLERASAQAGSCQGVPSDFCLLNAG